MGIQLVHGLLSFTRCPLLGMFVIRGSTVDLSHYILCVVCHDSLLPSFCYFLLYSSGGQDALTDLKGVIIVYIIIYNFFYHWHYSTHLCVCPLEHISGMSEGNLLFCCLGALWRRSTGYSNVVDRLAHCLRTHLCQRWPLIYRCLSCIHRWCCVFSVSARIFHTLCKACWHRAGKQPSTSIKLILSLNLGWIGCLYLSFKKALSFYERSIQLVYWNDCPVVCCLIMYAVLVLWTI